MHNDSRQPSLVRWAVIGFAAYALIGGSVTLLGWFAGLSRLTDWPASGISMFPNAALASVCSGAALVFAMFIPRWCARLSSILGLFVTILASATLFEHFSGVDLGIDTLLVEPLWGTKAATSPGRMGPPASISFTLLGIALTIIGGRHARVRRFVPLLGISVSIIAALSLIGYILGADPLFAVARFTGIAMQTASVLLALALGIVASAPESEPMRTLRANSAAGLLARRSLPFIVALPIVLGWLRVRGQRAGLFDTAMGTSLLILLLVLIFSGLLWWLVGAVAKYEHALRKSDTLLSEMLKQLPVGLGVTDLTGKWIISNAIMDESVPQAIPSMHPEMIKRWRAYESDGREVLPENWPGKRALRGEIVSPGLEMLFTGDDGRVRWMRVSAAPLRDDAQQIIGVTYVVHDIDQIKRAQDKIAEQSRVVESVNARLQGIISSAMDAVITIDSRQRIVLFNPAAEAMFGLSAKEAEGEPIDILIPERFRPTHGKFVDAFGRTGVSNRKMGALGSISGLRSNGEEFPIEASISQIEIGGEKLFTVILRDITERKKAEERDGRLVALVDNAEDSIIGKNLEGIVTSWNPGAEALFGYSAAEMIGRSIRQMIPPDCAAEEDMILLRLRAGEAVHRETVRLKKNGQRVPVSIICSPVKDAAGKIIGGAKIARDITEQKETEEKLRDAQGKLLLHAADLEATVAERTAKLQETVNDLQSFSYSIAHDMRAPLRAMGTFAQLLVNEMPAGAPPETKTYCERIVIGAARLDDLINDALNYTKAALQESPVQDVDVSKLVRGLLDTYPNLHPEYADISIEENLPVILGNEALLTQCFSNLLGNAVKFVAPGVRPKVRVWSERHDGFARIWVEDNGIGIPKHAQPRLFAMFQKLDNQYDGTGIGLAIVRKVVERMGGKVGVESEPDRGSRFWVELRAAQKKENV